MKRHEVPQLPQDSHFGALPNAPGMLGSSAELVRTQKCQQAGNDHEGWWKAEGEQKQMNEKICTVHHPYSKTGDPAQKWIHPSASCISRGDGYGDEYESYHCPICGLRFDVEIAQ